MTQRSPIPTNIITGFLGVGKTTTIVNLLKQKPSNENWAILVNEFGEIGLDGALIASASGDASQVFIREVPGGCMCCASGLPMQIALSMLIMKAKPDRLLIEPTGLGHPKEVLKVLTGEHYQDVLSLNSSVTLIDARHFNSAKHLDNATFQQQLDVADLLVMNKSDLANDIDIIALEAYVAEHSQLSKKPLIRIQHGKLAIKHLQPGIPHSALNADEDTLHHSHSHTHSHQHSHKVDEAEPALPACGYLVKTHTEGSFTSVGWRIHEQKNYVLADLLAWLKSLNATRIKALVHCEQGYTPLNLSLDENVTLGNEYEIHAAAKHSKAENRVEIIFQDQAISDELISKWTAYLCS